MKSIIYGKNVLLQVKCKEKNNNDENITVNNLYWVVDVEQVDIQIDEENIKEDGIVITLINDINEFEEYDLDDFEIIKEIEPNWLSIAEENKFICQDYLN